MRLENLLEHIIKKKKKDSKEHRIIKHFYYKEFPFKKNNNFTIELVYCICSRHI